MCKDFLKCQGPSYGKYAFDLLIKADIGKLHSEGETSLFHDDNREDDAYGLCHNSGKGRACHIHIKDGNKKEVTEYIYYTGYEYKKKRSSAVSHSTEYGTYKVICHDKYDAGSADPDVLYRKIQSFFRSLHGNCNGAGKEDHDNKENCGNNNEKCDGASYDLADTFFFICPYVSSD